MVTSSAGIGDLLHEVLVCGDEQQVRFIRARHVSDGLLSAIADATHEYAMSMITDPGAGDGWFTFPGGILSWWAVEAGLSDEEQRRLHRFRSDVVRLLEEGDVALRTHPQSTPLLVRASGGTSSNLYWLRDEVVLALELYVKAGCLNGGSLPGKTSPLVAGLSSELQALPVHPQAMRPEDFRNIDGVALELANLRAAERTAKRARGVKGAEQLPRGIASYSGVDLAVFEDYLDGNFEGLGEDALAIRTAAAVFDDAVTRPTGEDRPLETNEGAAYEAAGTEGGPRNRAEQALVCEYADWMKATDVKVIARWYRVPGSARPLRCDAYLPDRNLLVEAKGSDARSSIRMAIGQLLDYRRLQESHPSMAVLLPHKPSEDIQELLATVDVAWICRRRSKPGFIDSVNGMYVS